MTLRNPKQLFPRAISTVALIGLTAVLNAETILLDIQPSNNNAGTSVTSTAADFQVYDSNADTSAPVNVVTTWAGLQGLTLNGVSTNTYTVETTGQADFEFNAGGNNNTYWSTDLPILEGYAFENQDEPVRNTVTITGISQIPADELITLTVFALADNVGQDASVTPSYGENVFAEMISSYGTSRTERTEDDPATPDVDEGARPALQWQFVSDGVTDTISFDWGAVDADTAGLNGFMITSTETSNVGTVDALTVTAPVTNILNRANPFPLAVRANFSLIGEVDAEALTSNTSYAAVPAGIVTISPTGQVTPIGPGTATITVTVTGDGGSSMSEDIELVVEPIQAITINVPDAALLQQGFPTDLSFTANGTTLTNVAIDDFTALSLSLSTADAQANVDDIAELDLDENDFSQGIVTPVFDAGVVTVTAELPQGSAVVGTADIAVEAPTSLTLTSEITTLFVDGGAAAIELLASTANLTDINVTELLADGSLDWEIVSNDIDVVDIAGTGQFVEPVGIGTTNIEAVFGTTTTTSLAFTVEEITDRPIAIRHRYSFNETAASESLAVVDSVNGRNGVIVGEDTAFTGTSLTLPGGGGNSTAGYVDLPNGMISALPRAVTFEVFATVANPTVGNWERFFDFGSSRDAQGNPLAEDVVARGDNYLALIAKTGMFTPLDPGQISASYTLSGDDVGGDILRFATMQAPPAGQVHVVLVYDTEFGQSTLYVDGVSVAETNIPLTGSDLSDLNDINNWLGRSQWAGDMRFGGEMNEFRIYEGVMTPDQVTSSLAAGPDADLGAGVILPSVDGTQITGVSQPDANTLVIDFAGDATTEYQLQSSGTLEGFANVDSATVTTDANGAGQFTVTIDTTATPTFFYRVSQ